MTIGAQSVSAMMPKRIVVVFGRVVGVGAADPARRAARRAAPPAVVAVAALRNVRRDGRLICFDLCHRRSHLSARKTYVTMTYGWL